MPIRSGIPDLSEDLLAVKVCGDEEIEVTRR
nr:hypothetical protein [Tanacetum cinerariifolium]